MLSKAIFSSLILFSLSIVDFGMGTSCFNIWAETYVTWETMEVDKCASAWLIKRFIDQDAVFKFIPKGEFVKDGIPFDTPDSKFRRYHNLSTFESILKAYKIQDPALIHIGKMTHDIEISYWAGRKIEGSQELEEEIRNIIKASKKPDECFQKSFALLDRIHREIKNKMENQTGNF